MSGIPRPHVSAHHSCTSLTLSFVTATCVQGVLLGGGSERVTEREGPTFVSGLCEAFDLIRDVEILPGKLAYAQRDFVFLMRSLRRAHDAVHKRRGNEEAEQEVRARSVRQ